MRNRRFLIVSLLLLAIGFSSVTTVLYLTNSLTIQTNKEDFEVIFTSAVLDGVDVTSEPGVISIDKRGIDYTTKDLAIKGVDSSLLQYTIANNSSQYDASVSVVCGEDLADDPYVIITSSLNNEVIKAGESLAGTVRVDLKKSALEEVEDKLLHCDIKAVAIEKGIND